MLTVEAVRCAALRQDVYALRYRAYLHEGAIEPNPSGLFRDRYDDQPNHILWALFDEGKLRGSLRTVWFHPRDPWSIPERDCFPEAIAQTLPPEARLIAGNRFVTEPFRAHRTAAYAMELLKHHLARMPGRADYALAAVRANHLRFYRQIMRMDRISEPRIYPGLNCPMYLLASNVEQNLTVIWAHTPALRPDPMTDEAAA